VVQLHLPVGASDVPALSLRPDHAARLEGVHSRDDRLDRRRGRDGGARGGPMVGVTAARARRMGKMVSDTFFDSRPLRMGSLAAKKVSDTIFRAVAKEAKCIR